LETRPLVSIIIIHYRRVDLLHRCLLSLVRNVSYAALETIVVCNSPLDDDLKQLSGCFSGIRYIYNDKNLGYAGGGNAGIRAASGQYIFILNNDIEVDADCIAPLVEVCENDPSIAMAQPKILSLLEKNRFEYAGAAGGLIDIWGYPFARGRLFGDVEFDNGQYNDSCEIFWASGAALFARKRLFDEVGFFDEYFFAYMEEIDLAWRMHLRGYKIVYIPTIKVYHVGSPNIDRRDTFHLYLNHRNNLIMLLKNLSFINLLWIFPIRLVMDFTTVFFAFFKENPRRGIAIAKALSNILCNLAYIVKQRGQVQRLRKIKDAEIFSKMYHRSVAMHYFLFKRKTIQELPNLVLKRYHYYGKT